MSIFDRLFGQYKVGGINALRRRSRSQIGIVVDPSPDGTDLTCRGYTSLKDCPEIFTACRKIATLIASMTIMLMENGGSGDTRIFNELSRKLDIDPNKYMTRHTWMEAIVMNMLLYGKGNSVATVRTYAGLIQDITPIAASRVSITPKPGSTKGYVIYIDGKAYNPDDVLHFVDNPDPNYPWKGRGLQAILKDVADNLRQASVTKKGFMSSKWKPSLIIRVDSMTEEFSTPEGRQKLIESYVQSARAGEPWLIPYEQFSVEQVKPLSLADLAISDSVRMDKETVAAIIGVPPFVLGVGTYDKEAWNAFINTTVRTVAQEIEQELTRKLILNPKWYLRFNMMSLIDWDIKTIADVFGSLSDRGFVTGNEVRDRIGMSPADGLDEFRILENFIPNSMIGLQNKLVQEE